MSDDKLRETAGVDDLIDAATGRNPACHKQPAKGYSTSRACGASMRVAYYGEEPMDSLSGPAKGR
jgi:hypothetical protein